MNLEAIQTIYKLSVQIAFYRSHLHISEKSLIFRIKALITRKKSDAPQQLNKMPLKELQAKIRLLKKYLAKLTKVYSVLYPVILLENSVYTLLAFGSTFFRNKINNKGGLLIVFGVIPFQYRFQRPQHLIHEMSKFYNGNIVYIEPKFIESFLPTLPIYRSSIANGVTILETSASKNLHLQLQLASKKDELMIINSINAYILNNESKDIIIKIDHPFWSFVPSYFKDSKIIYDCLDYHESFEVGSNHLLTLEKNLVKQSDIVIAASNSLYKKMKAFKAKNITMIKNACEFDHFHGQKIRAREILNMHLPGKIIGYYGAIAEWLDENIIIQLARDYPNDTIVMVGEVSHPTIKYLCAKYKNVLFLGEVKYTDLPKYLSCFDICLIPFIINKLIKATNPVKIYEYFAAGKPVVASNIPELQDFKNIMYLSKNKNEFSKKVGLALKEKNNSLKKKRIEIAKKNTWETRGVALMEQFNALI